MVHALDIVMDTGMTREVDVLLKVDVFAVKILHFTQQN